MTFSYSPRPDKQEMIALLLALRLLHRLEENISAAKVELTRDDLQEIDRAASLIHVQGDRYPGALDQLTGR